MAPEADAVLVDAHEDAPVAPELHALARDIALAESFQAVGLPQVRRDGDVSGAAHRVLGNTVRRRKRAHVDRGVLLSGGREQRDAGRLVIKRKRRQRGKVGLEFSQGLRIGELADDPDRADVDAQQLRRIWQRTAHVRDPCLGAFDENLAVSDRDLEHSGAAFLPEPALFPDEAGLDRRVSAADRRMPCERQFLPWREYSQKIISTGHVRF